VAAVAAAPNPLRAGLRLSRVPEPSVLVIFGGTGDLTSRKLMPALYDLARQRLLPAAFAVVGIGRAQLTDAEYRQQAHDAVAKFSRSRPIDEEVWRTFAERLFYVSVRTDAGYDELRARLERFDRDLGTGGGRLFYLATPPAAYVPIVTALGRHDIARNGTGWARIVVEKPFGRDVTSATALTGTLHQVFRATETCG
jgi:glucose-6-phosphate 1-dehydrogenase